MRVGGIDGALVLDRLTHAIVGALVTIHDIGTDDEAPRHRHGDAPVVVRMSTLRRQ